jgi:hypothetical protein
MHRSGRGLGQGYPGALASRHARRADEDVSRKEVFEALRAAFVEVLPHRLRVLSPGRRRKTSWSPTRLRGRDERGGVGGSVAPGENNARAREYPTPTELLAICVKEESCATYQKLMTMVRRRLVRLWCGCASRSPYGMQHGLEQRLFDRLLERASATMNTALQRRVLMQYIDAHATSTQRARPRRRSRSSHVRVALHWRVLLV